MRGGGAARPPSAPPSSASGSDPGLPPLAANGSDPGLPLLSAVRALEANASFNASSGYPAVNPAWKMMCTLKVRQAPKLPKKFFSKVGPFAEPTKEDYEAAPREKIVMREVDQVILKDRLFFLQTITTLLEKYQIPYWLEAGSLLGAYRHQGFIPWDDDIDLTVPIGFQKRILSGVSAEASMQGIKIMQLWFPQGNSYYQPVSTYIRHHAPRVAATDASNGTRGTFGYFVQAWYKGLKLDMWQAFPVVLNGKVLYATGAAGTTLFSRKDVFPLRKVKFEGRSFPGPRRIHRYLVGIYGDIALPPRWQTWYNIQKCMWNPVMADSVKVPDGSGTGDFATLRFDQKMEPYMDVPKKVLDEVDKPGNYQTASVLGSSESTISPYPSGYGYPSWTLAVEQKQLPNASRSALAS